MSGREQTKRLTVSAMLSALGVVILWLGSAVEVVDISMAVIASLFCVFAVIEYGKGTPWLVFLVTGALSLILLPNKTPAVMYLVFFGYYPILKERLERLPRWLSWLLKEAVFHGALGILFLLWRLTLTSSETGAPWFYVTFLLMAEIAFPLYDVALTRMISLYLFKLRRRFRIK